MVNPIQSQTLPDRIAKYNEELTPKSRIIGDYVKENPRKVVFMTVAELAKACEVSEATVVRFVGQLGYEGYSDFQQSLREFVDTELTLLDRVDLKDMLEPGAERFRRVVSEEIDNLRQLFEQADVDPMGGFAAFQQSTNIRYRVAIVLHAFLLYGVVAHQGSWRNPNFQRQ